MGESKNSMAMKKKIEAPQATTTSTEEPLATTTTDTDSASFRNWPDLAEDLLSLIRHRLSRCIPDLIAFSGVCRSWRSFSAATSASRCPPFLLIPAASPTPHGTLRWSAAPQCRLQSLTGANRYRCRISSETLKKKCIGCSNGQLIFVGRKKAVVADIFTGQEVLPPDFPADDRRFTFGILTAPVHSASCLLLLVSSDAGSGKFSNILWWQPGSSEWSKLSLKNAVTHGIISMGILNKQIVAIDSLYNLTTVEFVPRAEWSLLRVRRPVYDTHRSVKVDQYLAECGQELLLVVFISTIKIVVYRLDWSKLEWVRVQELGNWCLFVDVGRKFAVSCPNPTEWGGRNNCIYFAGPTGGDGDYTEVPVEGGGINTGQGHLFYSPRTRTFQWPAPMWVYPSRFN